VNQSQIESFIWGVADLIRDTVKRGQYQDVILPLTVLRRLDCVLADTKGQVLTRQAELRGTESVPLSQSLEKFFYREIRRHVPDAWINTTRRDPRVGHRGSHLFQTSRHASNSDGLIW
jgi:type I restriction-modification system DNA methylase subunit